MRDFTKEQQDRMARYYADLRQRLSKLGKRHRQIAELIVQDMENEYAWHRHTEDVIALLWREGTQHIEQIFAGEDYELLRFLLGDEHAAIFRQLWDRATQYPYSQGYYRRSFRTSEQTFVHMERNMTRLWAAIQFRALDQKYEPSLIVSDMANYPFLCDYMAYELDKGNAELLEKARAIIYEDNSAGLLTRNIVKGLLMSSSAEAHRYVGDLLKAAKLQEGLRQTIAESMDETSREGFIYILGIIIEEEMWRFSSIVRAFDVWTGLSLDSLKPSVIKKCLQAAYAGLTDDQLREQYLQSEDSQLLYIGLWAAAFNEMVQTVQKIIDIAEHGAKYQQVAALQFVMQCQASDFQQRIAVYFLENSDLEVLGWAAKNLYANSNIYHIRYSELSDLKLGQGSESDWTLFEKLRQLLERMPGKELTLPSHGLFPDSALTANEICGKMLSVSYNCGDISMCKLLLGYRDKMQPDIRGAALRLSTIGDIEAADRELLLAMLGDKSAEVRAVAKSAVERLKLTSPELRTVEDLLQYKAGDIRKTAIQLLQGQPQGQLVASIERLLSDKKEDKRLGGLDLVLSLQPNTAEYEACTQLVGEMTAPSARERVLMEQIIGTDTESYGPENGYGLYDPSLEFISFPEQPEASPSMIGRLLGKGPDFSGITDILSSTPAELHARLKEWSELIGAYRDFEYEVDSYDGGREKLLLGSLEWGLRPVAGTTSEREDRMLDDYPLAEEWRALARKQQLTPARLIELQYYLSLSRPDHWHHVVTLEAFLKSFPILAVKKWLNSSAIDQFDRLREGMPYLRMIGQLLELLYDECDKEACYDIVYKAAADVYESLKQGIADHHKPLAIQEVIFPQEHSRVYYHNERQKIEFTDVVKAQEVSFWIRQLKEFYQRDDKRFEEGFKLLYRYARIHEWEADEVLDLAAYARALELGIITEIELYKELLGRPAGVDHLQSMQREHIKTSLTTYPKAAKVVTNVAQRVVEIELKRGDSDTPVSRLAQKVDRYEGMRHMVQCLLGLGQKDSLARGYFYSWGSKSKKEMISHLLKGCYPAAGEDADTLKSLLQGHQIHDQRLVDVAMYAPQWVSIVEQYLGWEGLASTCWYFHAHVSEMFTKEKETIVGRYSPISPMDLNEGAFDIAWFLEAYKAIGEKRFRYVYESAKYISDGANHRRSQLFADAVLGKLDAEQVGAELSSKRNKNHVLSFGLIPLPEDNRQGALIRRYELLQQFAKESKQFGAQRRDSEGKAVRLALDNLARGAGFSDVTRMTWRVEAEQFKQIAVYFEPMTVEDWQLQLALDASGKTMLQVAKAGKPVSKLPDKLKKNETVLQLKEVQKKLKDQYSRSREALERAMVTEEPFTFEELRIIQENRVIAPLIQALVFKSGEELGYLTGGGLLDPDGVETQLGDSDLVWVAHPVHLFMSGTWALYQREMMARQTVQPFKQVFRELYLPNEDELLKGTTSSRYAGHQIQPRKAAALLKSRLWTVSYEEGLQKVFHKQDVIATMYAMADWFSPAEVEAPTIESVAYYSRRTGKPLHVSEIPPVLFSEIMRDIDLVVSVAHVGGVDPEASLSTVEMRAALVRELLPLLKLDNVTIKGSQAFIVGALGEYTVHLGSGIVHRQAAGALNIIPVHSQQRGRLFLPFVDEDPRTAEVISKVLLLAEDRKIKDPAILQQLQDRVTN
ncbi:uncharacterized protein DUF4132 [Paenibacillus taihuensis]|uniref:Uncharacterized protein DUF4132 n=1 Tax=Paenibacillus taihuensis TaxID=1156355 RepID=A0A3D9SK51_9BACL|nr:DUF4132 domain-containing protein [Paenibacillus taihuensis]REE91300.1 uncharacterized protein DUF4132 [Paenibacillus taihuensis]